MIGTIVVTDDKTKIPSPAEVEKMGKAEVEAVLADGDKGYVDLLKKFPHSLRPIPCKSRQVGKKGWPLSSASSPIRPPSRPGKA
jgi:hypothetical protein